MSAGWERGATDDLRAGTAWFPVVVGGSQDQSQSHHMWEGRSSRRMGHWLVLSHPYPRHGTNTVMEAPRIPNGGRHRSQEVRDKRHLENHGPAFLWPSLSMGWTAVPGAQSLQVITEHTGHGAAVAPGPAQVRIRLGKGGSPGTQRRGGGPGPSGPAGGSGPAASEAGQGEEVHKVQQPLVIL